MVTLKELKGYVQLRRKSWVDVSMELDCLTSDFAQNPIQEVQKRSRLVQNAFLDFLSAQTSQEAGYNSVLRHLTFRSAEQYVFVYNKNMQPAELCL